MSEIPQLPITAEFFQEPKTNERLGLRCPEAIFDEITAQAALTAKTRQAAVRAKDVKNLEAARKAMLRLFPRMPPNIVKRVLDRGYEKGSRRVGRTTKLDDDEKVTLAVTAYARHNHTNYDEQIQEFRRRGEWVAAKPQARAAIFLQLEGILSQWRAERTPRPPRRNQGANQGFEIPRVEYQIRAK